MRKEDIQVGKTYTNGKGRLRKVDHIVPRGDIPYDIFYSVPGKVGNYGPTLAYTFARWAKEKVADAL